MVPCSLACRWLLLMINTRLMCSSGASSDFDKCSNESCPATPSGDEQTPDAAASSLAAVSAARRQCEEFYRGLPDRRAFFSRVQMPHGMPPDKRSIMLAKGGINPRGVVLNSEFYELPLVLNRTLLQEEVSVLVKEGWEKASASNSKQGVVSQHLRLTRGLRGDLVGPFEEVEGRLARSPYLRSVLAALGGVVGNVALMGLEPGLTVDEHFDTSSYWNARVRVHIPVETNKKVVFACGQRGEMFKLQMKVGKAYVFDNHLGHIVKNGGKTRRIHLVVDLVGSRNFWHLVRGARAIGSTPRKATMQALEVPQNKAAQVAVEAWSDSDLQQKYDDGFCAVVSDALAKTAAQINKEAEARVVASEWCAELRRSQKDAKLRQEQVRFLQQLGVSHACRMTSQGALAKPSLADVADVIAAVHRLAEADAELAIIGGETVT